MKPHLLRWVMYIILLYNKTCGHTLEKKMGSLSVQSLYLSLSFSLRTFTKYIMYDVPKLTTIRCKCAFKLLHACTRWMLYTVHVYHNNGFFFEKKNRPSTNKRTQQEYRYTEKKTNLSYSSLQFRNAEHYLAGVICSPLTRYILSYNSLMGLMNKNWNACIIT